jgi:hypothetical protein
LLLSPLSSPLLLSLLLSLSPLSPLLLPLLQFPLLLLLLLLPLLLLLLQLSLWALGYSALAIGLSLNSEAYMGRWALFTGGLWPPKQGRGPVAIKTRHAKRIRGKKVL